MNSIKWEYACYKNEIKAYLTVWLHTIDVERPSAEWLDAGEMEPDSFSEVLSERWDSGHRLHQEKFWVQQGKKNQN